MKAPIIVAAFAALAIAPVCLASESAKTQTTKTLRQWPAEDLSGQIDLVDKSRNLLIVKADNTIFDIVVTPRTKILDGGKRIRLADLTANKDVKIHFVPERNGDIAELIELR